MDEAITHPFIKASKGREIKAIIDRIKVLKFQIATRPPLTRILQNIIEIQRRHQITHQNRHLHPIDLPEDIVHI